MRGISSYFSMAQWQEHEVHVCIFRHMIVGAPVPPQLLHLVKKSLILNSHSFSPYYQFSPYHTALLQSGGYWGRGGMDPELGRCRRTDGKKWRCSRDVVGGYKYCERHMHRGRNHSRNPVEIPTPSTDVPLANNNNINANSNSVGVIATQTPIATTFGLSRPSHSFDLLHLNHREDADSTSETRDTFSDSFSDESENEKLSRWDGCSSEEWVFEQENLWHQNDRLGHLYCQHFEKSTPYGRVPLMDKVYGEEARKATNEGLDAAGHAIGTAWDR